MIKSILIREPTFYCYQDEKSFFDWLQSVVGIERFEGEIEGLKIYINLNIFDESSFADVAGLFARYEINMQILRELMSTENMSWFEDRNFYWHSMIFPESSSP
jgi:hypothetical protein